MQNAFFHTPYNVGIGGEAPPFSYKEYYKEYRKKPRDGGGIGQNRIPMPKVRPALFEGLLKTRCF